MNICDTCGHQFSDVCGNCEGLDGVPVKYTEKGSKPIVPICGTCVFKEHCAVAGCSHYEKRLKQTNADRIRNMTDEELAVQITRWTWGRPSGNPECGWLEWLKQE